MNNEDNAPEFIEEADVNLAAIVHGNIARANEAVKLMERTLSDGADIYSIPREIVVALVEIIKTDVKMVTDMFEENQQFHDQAQKWQALRDKGRQDLVQSNIQSFDAGRKFQRDVSSGKIQTEVNPGE